MDWLIENKGTIGSLLLILLPHIVAVSPSLAKGEGVISALLNLLAGNYGEAKNKGAKK